MACASTFLLLSAKTLFIFSNSFVKSSNVASAGNTKSKFLSLLWFLKDMLAHSKPFLLADRL